MKMYKIIGVILYFVYVVENKETTETSLSGVSDADVTEDNLMKELKIITRAEWGARPAQGPVNDLPVYPPPFVVVHHSATVGCTSQTICSARVRSFQNYHMDHNKWSDIGYNFLVGEDGLVYEGRGWGKRGAHCPKFNPKSIGICVIGNFTSHEPNLIAIETLKDLIEFGVSKGEIQSDYKLIGHRQGSRTECPGNSLYDLIKTFPHFDSNP